MQLVQSIYSSWKANAPWWTKRALSTLPLPASPPSELASPLQSAHTRNISSKLTHTPSNHHPSDSTRTLSDRAFVDVNRLLHSVLIPYNPARAIDGSIFSIINHDQPSPSLAISVTRDSYRNSADTTQPPPQRPRFGIQQWQHYHC